VVFYLGHIWVDEASGVGGGVGCVFWSDLYSILFDTVTLSKIVFPHLCCVFSLSRFGLLQAMILIVVDDQVQVQVQVSHTCWYFAVRFKWWNEERILIRMWYNSRKIEIFGSDGNWLLAVTIWREKKLWKSRISVSEWWWSADIFFFFFFSWTASYSTVPRKETKISRNNQGMFRMASDKVKLLEDVPSQGTELEMISVSMLDT